MEEIDVIISRYLSEEASEKDLEKLYEWLKASEENQLYFAKMKKASILLDVEYKEKEWENAFEQFKHHVSQERKNSFTKWIRVWEKIAAVLILPLIIATLCLYQLDLKPDSVADQVKEFYTPVGANAKIMLEDGTEVWLNSNSKLKYSEAFNKEERKVELTGEAFFKVAHNANKAFVVGVNGLKVKVLGTVFNVNAYNPSIVETSLQQGKVELSSNRSKTRKILHPGEKAVYQVASGRMDIRQIEPNGIGTWRFGNLVFSNTPMGDVVKALERRYDVKITLKDKELYNYRFTATIQKESLQQLLSLIKISSPINYEINNKQVIIFKNK